MIWSKCFIPTLKEVPIQAEAKSHQLLLRAGLIHMLTSGVYSYLPLGLRVLKRVEGIIREEMNAIGAQELFLPVLQPIDLWKQTGRDQTLEDVMIRFEDKKGRQMCLGPTHEEVITDLVKNYVQSYRQLPVTLYQIQTKFRDEIRPRFGIVRASEFIMKDAYSFDRDEKGLEKNYNLMLAAYKKIFQRCELDMVINEADSGVMGGDVSHEFLVPAAIGEDTVTVNGKEEVAIELGHIFKLGTKYSDAQEAFFLDADGKKKSIIMGCYGIGVSRMIAAIIEKNNDDKGIIWPRQVAPFDIEIVPIQISEGQTLKVAQKIYEQLMDEGFEVLLDDRDESPGVKFNDADLIGIPSRIIVGKKSLASGKVEIKDRRNGKVDNIDEDKVVETLRGLYR